MLSFLALSRAFIFYLISFRCSISLAEEKIFEKVDKSENGDFIRAHFDSNVFSEFKSKILVLPLPNHSDLAFETVTESVVPSEISGSFYLWYGTIKNGIFGQANVALFSNGQMLCTIQVETETFQCLPCKSADPDFGSTNCVLIKKVPVLDAFDDFEISNGKPKKSDEIDFKEINPKISVLVIFTENSVKCSVSEENLKNQIAFSFSQSNVVFSNNGINLEAKIVHWRKHDYSETGYMKDALTFLKKSEKIAYLRKKVNADLVAIVSHEMFGETDTNQLNCLAFESSKFGTWDPMNGFVAMEAKCLMSDPYLLSKAFGYVLGCRSEDNAILPQNVPYSYSFSNDPCTYGTIMSNGCGNGAIVPFYSSSKYSFNGEKIGSKEYSDCARVIEENKYLVSSYGSLNKGNTKNTSRQMQYKFQQEFPSQNKNRTSIPTLAPTSVRTLAPTSVPTLAPTPLPTFAPTPLPTLAPTIAPLKPTSSPVNATPSSNSEISDSSPESAVIGATIGIVLGASLLVALGKWYFF